MSLSQQLSLIKVAKTNATKLRAEWTPEGLLTVQIKKAMN